MSTKDCLRANDGSALTQVHLPNDGLALTIIISTMRDTSWTGRDMGKSCVKPVEKTNKSL